MILNKRNSRVLKKVQNQDLLSLGAGGWVVADLLSSLHQ